LFFFGSFYIHDKLNDKQKRISVEQAEWIESGIDYCCDSFVLII